MRVEHFVEWAVATADKGRPTSLGIGRGLKTPCHKNKLLTKCHDGPQTWVNSFNERPKHRNVDMGFGTQSVRTGSLMAIRMWATFSGSTEGQMGQRWRRTSRRIHIFLRKGEWGTGFLVKRVEFVSDRRSYIILRGRWCHIIVLNVHAPTEDKTTDVPYHCSENSCSNRR
jgi:hypothetical protein